MIIGVESRIEARDGGPQAVFEHYLGGVRIGRQVFAFEVFVAQFLEKAKGREFA